MRPARRPNSSGNFLPVDTCLTWQRSLCTFVGRDLRHVWLLDVHSDIDRTFELAEKTNDGRMNSWTAKH